MDRNNAFAAPPLFELMFDRVAATRFPSRHLVASAAMSATSTDQLDRLAGVLGRQSTFLHLSPRRLELMGLVLDRRMLLHMAGRIERSLESSTGGGADGGDDERDDGDDRDADDIGSDDLHDAVALLKSTSRLLK